MNVIEFAKYRLHDPDNDEYEYSYWAAYLDGAKAQKREYEKAKKEKEKKE